MSDWRIFSKNRVGCSIKKGLFEMPLKNNRYQARKEESLETGVSQSDPIAHPKPGVDQILTPVRVQRLTPIYGKVRSQFQNRQRAQAIKHLQ